MDRRGKRQRKGLLDDNQARKDIDQVFIRSLFDYLDINNDGAISLEELCKSISMLDVELTTQQVHDLIDQVDVNQNGRVDYHEFKPLLVNMVSKAVKSYSELVFLNTVRQDEMLDLQDRLSASRIVHGPDTKITHVAILVVVLAEIQPLFDEFEFSRDYMMEKSFGGLAKVFKASLKDGFEITLLQAATSAHYCRHYSGYTQSAGIAALVGTILEPDILISFGTSGGLPQVVSVGDVVLASGCVFLNRTRTSSKNDFDWGVYGGPTMPCPNLVKDLNLIEAYVGSQLDYTVNELHLKLITSLKIGALDMESAPEAQILMQTNTNFMAIKVISNGVYPGDGNRMEAEYQQYKAQVSKTAALTITKVIDYLQGKRLKDL